MSARGACPRGFARVDRHDRDARHPGLVLHERAQLKERPSRMPGALPLPNRGPLANPLEVFQGDSAIGAFGTRHDGLADDVVLMSSEPGFPARKLLEAFLGSPSSLTLESSPAPVVSLPDLLDRFARIGLAVAVRREVDDAEVHSQEVGGWHP